MVVQGVLQVKRRVFMASEPQKSLILELRRVRHGLLQLERAGRGPEGGGAGAEMPLGRFGGPNGVSEGCPELRERARSPFDTYFG